MSLDPEYDAASAFQAEGLDLDASAAAEASRLCIEHDIKPSEVVIKWEAFAIANNRGTGAPSARDLGGLFPATKPALPSAPVPLVRRAALPPPVVNVDDFFSYLDGPDPPEPSAPEMKKDSPLVPAPVITSGAAVGRFVDVLPGDDEPKLQAGTARTVSELNELRNGTQALCDVHVINSVGGVPEYMNDSLEIAVEVLRERVRSVGSRILARIHASGGVQPDVSPSPNAFTDVSPSPVLALGRVRVELDGGGGAGRLNASSVVLESEDGVLVKLNLMRLKGLKRRIFLTPGMVVIVLGMNTNRKLFDVYEVFDDSRPLISQVTSTQTSDGGVDDKHPVAKVLVATGPFTLPSNLRYDPLETLLAGVVETKPDVVILLGPFVDANHSVVKDTLPVEFNALFESRVLQPILDTIDKIPRVRFCLVPSVDDVHHVRVCPQPCLPSSGLPSSVVMAPNPTAIGIASGARCAVVGVTSLPTLADLSGDCVVSDAGDRMSALASHMIRQWSFYPTYPASPGVPYDVSLSVGLDLPECGLDVIVAPSVLQPFAKIVDGDVVAINPGHFSRGSSGFGSYAEFSVPLCRNSSSLRRVSTDVNIIQKSVGGRVVRMSK